jgi:hypothetical protein
MGCCDSKEARRDNFAGPGRVLGSAPEQRTSAPLPSNTSQSYGTTPGRTLGSGHDDGDPRARAALAAEVSTEGFQLRTLSHEIEEENPGYISNIEIMSLRPMRLR